VRRRPRLGHGIVSARRDSGRSVLPRDAGFTGGPVQSGFGNQRLRCLGERELRGRAARRALREAIEAPETQQEPESGCSEHQVVPCGPQTTMVAGLGTERTTAATDNLPDSTTWWDGSHRSDGRQHFLKYPAEPIE
jgi:hypothetical protein